MGLTKFPSLLWSPVFCTFIDRKPALIKQRHALLLTCSILLGWNLFLLPKPPPAAPVPRNGLFRFKTKRRNSLQLMALPVFKLVVNLETPIGRRAQKRIDCALIEWQGLRGQSKVVLTST